MPAQKLSITVEDDLVDEIRMLAGGNVSAFFAAAARDALRREHLRRFVEEELATPHPQDAHIRDDVERKWPV